MLNVAVAVKREPVSGNGPVMVSPTRPESTRVLRVIAVGVIVPFISLNVTPPSAILADVRVMVEESEHVPPLFDEELSAEKVTGPATTEEFDTLRAV